MRALVALALVVLAVPSAALAEPSERLAVRVGYPLPGGGVAVVVVDDPACTTHQALWQGWLALMDVAGYAWSHWAGLPSDGLDRGAERARAEAGALATRASDTVTDAERRSPAWAAEPAEALAWGWAQLGHEDLCVLGLAGVSTGL